MKRAPTLTLIQAFFCGRVVSAPDDPRRFFYEGITERAELRAGSPTERTFVAEFREPHVAGSARITFQLIDAATGAYANPFSDIIHFAGRIYRLHVLVNIDVPVDTSWFGVVFINGIEIVRKPFHVQRILPN